MNQKDLYRYIDVTVNTHSKTLADALNELKETKDFIVNGISSTPTTITAHCIEQIKQEAVKTTEEIVEEVSKASKKKSTKVIKEDK